MDLPHPERPHPGGRNRRRRPSPVPLPPEVAGRTERGEVRPGAGDVGRAARHATADRIGPAWPGPHPRPGHRAGAAAARSRLLPVGGEQYAEENNSFGLATLLCEHVTLERDAVEFDYPAKSGVRRTLLIDDPEVVRSVRALMRRPDRGERLLVCRNGSGWTELHADDLNARFKELVGDEYTVKDLRTWHGTVLAAAAFVDADPPANKTTIKRVESAVMKEVAEGLGNTPAVARGVLRRSPDRRGIRVRPHHRGRRTTGRADPSPGETSGHPGRQHRSPDPQGRQELDHASGADDTRATPFSGLAEGIPASHARQRRVTRRCPFRRRRRTTAGGQRTGAGQGCDADEFMDRD